MPCAPTHTAGNINAAADIPYMEALTNRWSYIEVTEIEDYFIFLRNSRIRYMKRRMADREADESVSFDLPTSNEGGGMRHADSHVVC